MKKPLSSYDALLGRVEKYIHVEEAQQLWKGEGDLATSFRLEKKMPRVPPRQLMPRPFIRQAQEQEERSRYLVEHQEAKHGLWWLRRRKGRGLHFLLPDLPTLS